MASQLRGNEERADHFLLDKKIQVFAKTCYHFGALTLGQRESDNINRMKTLTEDNIYQPYELYFKF